MSRINDNTAAGMALSQEESMYLTPAASPTAFASDDKENHTTARDGVKLEDDIVKSSFHTSGDSVGPNLPTTPPALSHGTVRQLGHLASADDNDVTSQTPCQTLSEAAPAEHTRESSPTIPLPRTKSGGTTPLPGGLAKVDLEINRHSKIKLWDFTDVEPCIRTPSAMLQPYAKYVGTQQSGHNTYNVEVTILTVNMKHSNISGFLKISDLTPEHPVLETFFTGEIVGGPNQRYSFRTMDPAWGTNERVDMQHWMRFPAWKQFSSIAKRDMGFEYPLNGQAWHRQEHIFMRWKERFLAPDHRKSNLSGASFEGFYYICLNQMEGKISGVYFHRNSEE